MVGSSVRVILLDHPDTRPPHQALLPHQLVHPAAMQQALEAPGDLLPGFVPWPPIATGCDGNLAIV